MKEYEQFSSNASKQKELLIEMNGYLGLMHNESLGFVCERFPKMVAKIESFIDSPSSKIAFIRYVQTEIENRLLNN